MYQSTNAFGELVRQRSRTFKAKLVVDGNTEITDGIKNITLNGGSNGKDTFVIGSAVSQYVTVTLNRPVVAIENHELEYLVGLEVNGSTEWIPFGFYTVGKVKTDENETSFTAYDRMLKTERAYFSNLPEETTTTNILSEIGTFLEIQILTSDLPSLPMKRPDGYTCREVLAYVAQMYGGFSVCDRSGCIIIQTYTDSNYQVQSSRYWDSFQHNDFPYTLEKITCYTGKDTNGNDISISVGSGVREMTVSNPFMQQPDLERIWQSLNGYTFMPGSLKFLGDPRIDPWDILTVIGTDGNTYKVPAMKLVQDFDGGLTTEIEAVGWTESEAEDGFSGPLTQIYERYATQLALINHAVINKLDVDVAKITYAQITDLEATNTKIENLDAVYAKIGDLNAANANIGTLNAAYANIENLLSGNAGVGDLVNIHLTTQNAVIDSALIKNLVSENISVNDLKAGIIYTDKMQIWSDTAGGMKLIGPTLQWTDKNEIVRMQAGLDAQGNFDYYICDAAGAIMWNALGLTSDAIKSPIIVNDMVADNANISAGKLDINSLESVINAGDLHIQSSVVKLDTSGQTLDAALSQIHEEINGIVSDDGTYLLQTWVEGNHDDQGETATIHAKVYVKNIDVTETIPSGRFLWSRNSEYVDEDKRWNARQVTGYSLFLSGDDVTMLADFQCLLTIPEEYSLESLAGDTLTDTNENEIVSLYV
ncbi:hypothetical protein [Hominifimenecus sp. rT4P-3]|uniref:hypothetical protein n=1 Tax=Hominifimenecus sp. rT4P-3 TaxID=3242979 RepID=UPI003DA67292